MNIKRKIPLILSGAVLIASLAVSPVLATTGTVTAQTVRVRKAASTDSEILKRAYQDQKIEIIGEEGEWYKVSYDGIEGYISKNYLKVNEENAPAEPTTSTVPTQTAEPSQTTEPAQSEAPTQSEEPAVEPEKTTSLGDTTNKETKAYVTPTFNGADLFKIESNQKVEVVATLANWSKVKINNNEGWIPNTVLMATSTETPAEVTPEAQPAETPEEKPAEQATEKAINQTGYISSNASANFRSEPTTQSTSINKLVRYTEVTVVSELDNGWYKVTYNGTTGYISKALITLGSAPEQPSSRASETTRAATQSNTQAVASSSSSQVVTGVAPASSYGGGVVSTATSLLGSRYVYGGSSPSGFDCSGFTSYVYAQNGVSLNRTAAGQLSNGVAVSKSDLQPGDLVMFGSSASNVYHVGIYVGGGQMIHAANSNRGVVYDTINSGYYANNYYGARRVQ